MPAPIDIKSVNWASERYHANWDGNQGASSRTLASGASATGDPRMVNVRIHEPLNPFIDNLPPPPYPFASVDLARAREGKAIFKANVRGAATRRATRRSIRPRRWASIANRTLVNTSVSRYGLAALVMEACRIYGLNHEGQPGADWCVPEGDWQARLDEYFRDTPRRVAEGTNGYKADMLHGIWAQAPVPAQRLGARRSASSCARPRGPGASCAATSTTTRPWSASSGRDRPGARYGPDDSMLVKELRHDRAGQGQHGPHLRRRSLSGHEPASIRSRTARRSRSACSTPASGRCSRT